MDDTTQTSDQHPASDDQELAKVLAGVNKEVEKIDGDSGPMPSGLHFEDTPSAPATADVPVDEPDSVTPISVPAPEPVPAPVEETPQIELTPSSESPTLSPVSSGNSELDSIKKDAIAELRPLVPKLNLPPEEKFNTILLIIRSTDDQSLLAPAHDAAKSIEDESKRAQALLDIIKEIDFFANQAK